MSDPHVQKVKEVRVSIGDLHMSPRKVRLVADLIKRRSVVEAREQLQFSVKKAARSILKLLDAAVASARHDFQMNPELLRVASITVNQGTMFKRFKPRAQGRAFPIRRRTSVVQLVLVEDISQKKPTRKRKPARQAPAAQVEAETPAYEREEQTQGSAAALQPVARPFAAPPRRSGVVKRFVEIKRRLFNRKTNA